MKYLQLWALMAVVLLAGACGGTPPVSTSPLATPASPAGGLEVVDALGRTVQFAMLPQRIVVAGKSSLTIVDTLYLFPEARERLIALPGSNQPIGEFVSLLDPTFGQKRILHGEAGPEQIAPLQPDVVILRSLMADRLGRSLEELNIPVVYVDLETPEQYFRDLAVLGRLLGNEVRAEEIRSFYRSRLDAVRQALQGLEESQKPHTLVIQYSDQGGEVAFQVPPASWLQTSEVEMAGGRPVWKEAVQGSGWTVVGLEQIAAWNPDVVIVIAYKGNSAAIVDRLQTDPQWQGLKAVQNGQIYGFPGDILSWDQPDPRWILGTLWLAGKLHPERFPPLEVKGEVVEFFGQMYGLDRAAIEAGIVPALRGNLE